MHQNALFPRTRDLLVSQKTTQRHFFSTLHPRTPVIFVTATGVAFVLLRNSTFNFRCYTQSEATPTQRSTRKWRCDILRKRLHSCKPASLNRPIGLPYTDWTHYRTPVYGLSAQQDFRVLTKRTIGLPCWRYIRLSTLQDSSYQTKHIRGLPRTRLSARKYSFVLEKSHDVTPPPPFLS